MLRKSARGAFIGSVLLHAALVGGAFFLVVFVPENKPPPAVFELFSAPNLPPIPDQTLDTEPELLPVEVVVIPEPEPIEKEPEPLPPNEKSDPPPVKISYEQFIKEQGKPVVQKPREVKPKPIKVPRINTSQILNNLRDIMVNTTQLNQMSNSEINALEEYFVRLKQALEMAWSKPLGLSDRLECVVEFDISSLGVLSSARIVASSENGDFDRSIVAAFKSVRNFGPTPDGRSYPARVTFRMTD